MAEPSVNRALAQRRLLRRVTNRTRNLYAAGLLTVALLPVPHTERADCASLAERRNMAAAKVIEALRSYEKCIAATDKRYDCDAEMQALDDAHDDLSDAITDLKPCP
jgi:hypothetical protein